MNVQIAKAKKFATDLHNKRNLTYGEGLEYSYHLNMVANTVHDNFTLINHNIYEEMEFMLILSNIDKFDMLITLEQIAWLHDTIEDCAITYNDLKQEFGEFIADCVYDLSNELGKNRKERHEKTAPKIAKNPFAVYVKLCDRIANMEYSISTGSSMAKKYYAERDEFIESISTIYRFDNLIAKLKAL